MTISLPAGGLARRRASGRLLSPGTGRQGYSQQYEMAKADRIGRSGRLGPRATSAVGRDHDITPNERPLANPRR